MRTMPRPPRRSRWSITAAIGHHLGVIDCPEAALTCPWDEYLAWIATLEAGSEARRKMEGVPKYGEIVIDINHVPMLPMHSIKPGSANFAAEGMEYNAVKYAA